MAYDINQGNNVQDLFTAIETLLTGNGWTEIIVSNNTAGKTDSAYFCGIGGGSDKIYIYISVHELENKLILDSAVGVDTHLGTFEQPGSIQQWLYSTGQKMVNVPAYTISTNERYFYWIFCDSYRLIVVTRMSTVYESAYLGFINPVASERQFPYPMYVCGNTTANGGVWPNNISGSFIFPHSNTGFLRRADGTWRAFEATMPDPDASSIGTVFPYNSHNKKLVPNYKEQDAVNQDNFLLIPICLQTNNPVDMCGFLRGCYWISGTRDIDAERLLVYNSEQYIVFDTKAERGANTYFCIEMK